MKVAKKNQAVKADAAVDTPVVETENVNPTEEQELNDMVLKDADGYIRSAISSLSGLYRRTGDAKYKEAIANLSVILLDLKS